MKESDQVWLSLFLISVGFWLATSGQLNFDPTTWAATQSPQTAESVRLDNLLAAK